jgi:ribonuclease HI
MMKQTAPHFLLLTQAQSNPDPQNRGGIWRFVLEQIGSSNRTEVSEEEPGVWGERLQLLAVVRGLEALDEPSRVTLITPSRFVGNGVRRGLTEWRKNGWQWERFDEKAPIKHCDLWKRVDHALQFHQINCRIWDFEEPQFNRRRPASRNRISFGEIESARKLSFADSNCARTNPPNKQTEMSLFEQTRAVRQPSTFVARHTMASREPTSLAVNVKPIGSGRAYGYVPN